MTVRVYLLNSLVDAKEYPKIAGGHIHMKGHFSIKLNLDPTIGHYLTINWTLHDNQKTFDLVSDINDYVVKITLLEDGYFSNTYVDGWYSCEFGLMRMMKLGHSGDKIFMEAESLEAFNKLVAAYRNGELVLVDTNETVLETTQNKLGLAEEKNAEFEKSFCYKIYKLLN